MKNRYGIRLIALLLPLLASWASAAEMTPPQRWMVTNYVVKPGMQLQHQALARRYGEAARASGWDMPWFTSVSIASDRPRVSVAIPVDSMTMFASPSNPVVAAEGPEAMVEILDQASRTYESVETIMAVNRPDLQHAPPESDSPPVGYWSIRTRVAPGKNAAYEEYLRSIVQASDEQYWNAFQGSFGSAGWYVANIPIYDWSDMDQPPGPPIPARLRAEFGDRRGNQIYEAGTALIEELHVELFRWDWDMSYFPEGG